jgi:hypothetical protein
MQAESSYKELADEQSNIIEPGAGPKALKYCWEGLETLKGIPGSAETNMDGLSLEERAICRLKLISDRTKRKAALNELKTRAENENWPEYQLEFINEKINSTTIGERTRSRLRRLRAQLF